MQVYSTMRSASHVIQQRWTTFAGNYTLLGLPPGLHPIWSSCPTAHVLCAYKDAIRAKLNSSSNLAAATHPQ